MGVTAALPSRYRLQELLASTPSEPCSCSNKGRMVNITYINHPSKRPATASASLTPPWCERVRPLAQKKGDRERRERNKELTWQSCRRCPDQGKGHASPSFGSQVLRRRPARNGGRGRGGSSGSTSKRTHTWYANNGLKHDILLGPLRTALLFSGPSYAAQQRGRKQGRKVLGREEHTIRYSSVRSKQTPRERGKNHNTLTKRAKNKRPEGCPSSSGTPHRHLRLRDI